MPTSAWKALRRHLCPRFRQEKAEAADDSDASTGGGDIQNKIALAQEGVSGAEKSRLYGEILINPEEALKSIKSSQERRLFLRKG